MRAAQAQAQARPEDPRQAHFAQLVGCGAGRWALLTSLTIGDACDAIAPFGEWSSTFYSFSLTSTSTSSFKTPTDESMRQLAGHGRDGVNCMRLKRERLTRVEALPCIGILPQTASTDYTLQCVEISEVWCAYVQPVLLHVESMDVTLTGDHRTCVCSMSYIR